MHAKHLVNNITCSFCFCFCNYYTNLFFLGRVLHTVGQTSQAISFLRQGLSIAQSLNKSEEEAKIRHRLGKFLLYILFIKSNSRLSILQY